MDLEDIMLSEISQTEKEKYCYQLYVDIYHLYQRRQWHPTPVFLPWKSHGWRSLVGYSPWGREESDTTGWLHFHFSLSCTGEGNGNPLQYSCLKNPRDGRAWWAAVYGVTQSQIWLMRLSSSISLIYILLSFMLPWSIRQTVKILPAM